MRGGTFLIVRRIEIALDACARRRWPSRSA
jgi:deferrochelatase/peroxidase EfeB